MAGDEVIEVSLLSGRSDQPTLTFTPGTPTNPVSVGTAGQWVVTGDGVESVHVYLVFDGRHVHVALGAANTDVRLAGARLGTDWVEAPVPCELRFGGACLILRHAPRAAAPLQEERTMHDGGALWQAAQRAAKGGDPLGPQYPAARPAAGAPANYGRTLPLVGAPPRVPPPEPHEAATTIRNPLVGAPVPEPVSLEQDVTRIAPQPLAPRAAQPPPFEPPSPNDRTANTSPGANDPLAFWRSASLAKKATLVLMPFALGASYFIFQPDAPPPPPARSMSTAGAPGSLATGARDASSTGSDAGVGAPDSGSLDTSPLPPVTSPDARADAPPKVAPLPAGKRTPERLALDAVAAGSFDEASRLYASLATIHPDDPAYKEAARILREKTGTPR
jgi:hypothetical protein